MFSTRKDIRMENIRLREENEKTKTVKAKVVKKGDDDSGFDYVAIYKGKEYQQVDFCNDGRVFEEYFSF
jgi:hypothetical protein